MRQLQNFLPVSQTPDPTGPYYAYTFDIGVSNDYPKLAAWPDGYYLITQEGYDCCNLDATVFDRSDMLNGAAATFQQQSFRTVNGQSHTVIALPSEFEGPAAPAGTPNLYARPMDGAAIIYLTQ